MTTSVVENAIRMYDYTSAIRPIQYIVCTHAGGCQSCWRSAEQGILTMYNSLLHEIIATTTAARVQYILTRYHAPYILCSFQMACKKRVTARLKEVEGAGFITVYFNFLVDLSFILSFHDQRSNKIKAREGYIRVHRPLSYDKRFVLSLYILFSNEHIINCCFIRHS